MTNEDIVISLRKLYKLKGWPVLSEAADRLAELALYNENETEVRAKFYQQGIDDWKSVEKPALDQSPQPS